MGSFYYDFHIHSCLSPCGDNESTPNSIAGTASLAGIKIVALTDHNTTRNCPAFFAAAPRYGVVPVAGCELTTAEDIHAVCLFDSLSGALEFDSELQKRRVLVYNRTDIFGEQLIMNENDEIIGSEPYLLSNATDVTIGEAGEFVKRFGGVCYPAHIDRPSNGIIAVLGTFPETSGFGFAELNDPGLSGKLVNRFPALAGVRFLFGSDAHYITSIPDAAYSIELECADNVDCGRVRECLFERLRE